MLLLMALEESQRLRPLRSEIDSVPSKSGQQYSSLLPLYAGPVCQKMQQQAVFLEEAACFDQQ
jgi:hypothetical protein